MRQTSRIAWSAPGSAIGRSVPTRSNRSADASRSSPPQAVPSVPYPVPSKATPRTGPSSPCSAMALATWAWWCWTATFTDSGRSSA